MRLLVCLTLLSLLTLSGCPNETQKVPVEPPQTVKEPPFVPEKGYNLITFSDFEQFPADDGNIFRESPEDGTILGNMGQKGFLYTKESYGDFTFRGELMFVKVDQFKGSWPYVNAGFLIYIQEPDKMWPDCLEIQGKFFEMGSIKANGDVEQPEINENDQMRQLVRQPIGEWNTFEIQSEGGAVTVLLNGQEVCSAKAGDLKEGRIGLQAEGSITLYRNLRLRPGPPIKESSSGMGPPG